MAMFQNPGAFFIGVVAPQQQKFLKILLENARKSGYTRFVEPCAGTFAMSHLAIQSGYKPENIETSDVSMFSSIMGYAVMGKSIDTLGIKAEGFSTEEMADPATALFAQIYLRTVKKAGNEYYFNLMKDLEYRREEHIQNIQKQIDEAKAMLHGMNYRALDMNEHFKECFEDPSCIVIANVPTYTAGYEKFFDTGGKMSWNEPNYTIFDPKTGKKDLFEKMKDAKCLFLCYEESPPGETAGSPIFARYGVRDGINTYVTTNKPEEAVMFARGKKITRPNGEKIEPLKCSILPRDYEITEKCKVEVIKVQAANAQYYRKLWTHNFTGSAAQINLALMIDGKIAGVFGLDKSALTIGVHGGETEDVMFLMYGMSVPHIKFRIPRLMTMLAQDKCVIYPHCTDLEIKKVKGLRTAQMTRYPESKSMRGLMKLVKRNPDKKMGYHLVYQSELFDRTLRQTLVEWLRKEEVWAKKKEKQQ